MILMKQVEKWMILKKLIDFSQGLETITGNTLLISAIQNPITLKTYKF